MAERKQKKPTRRSKAQAQTPSNLDQVRTLLFGDEVRASELRLETLQAELESSMAASEKSLMKKIEALEVAHDEAQRALSAERAARVQLNKKLLKLERTLASAQRRSERNLKSQAKALRGELDKRCTELGEELEAYTEELDSTKLSRSDAASLFADAATRLAKGRG